MGFGEVTEEGEFGGLCYRGEGILVLMASAEVVMLADRGVRWWWGAGRTGSAGRPREGFGSSRDTGDPNPGVMFLTGERCT